MAHAPNKNAPINKIQKLKFNNDLFIVVQNLKLKKQLLQDNSRDS
jgi:hypothetical protein